MRDGYLRLTVDVGGILILDDTGTQRISLVDLPISADLCDKLVDWGARYEEVTHWTQDRRRAELPNLRKLDVEGLSLRVQLATVLKGRTRIRYFSEALLREIDSIEEFDSWASRL